MSAFGVPAAAESVPATAILNAIPAQFSGEFLQWAVVFFVIAIIAAVVGARGVAGVSMTVAKWFVIVFLLLAIVSLLL
ncbi:DUF1328 domain-containing protein [Halorubrum trueperi]|uniref:UPF0391 membrane protein ACFQEY_15430 n=1 Tax=Halorubrum trueperi TaxID=2004704 RepID=A0ABD5ULT1_9EURY